jgi:hypothetical protein
VYTDSEWSDFWGKLAITAKGETDGLWYCVGYVYTFPDPNVYLTVFLGDQLLHNYNLTVLAELEFNVQTTEWAQFMRRSLPPGREAVTHVYPRG